MPLSFAPEGTVSGVQRSVVVASKSGYTTLTTAQAVALLAPFVSVRAVIEVTNRPAVRTTLDVVSVIQRAVRQALGVTVEPYVDVRSPLIVSVGMSGIRQAIIVAVEPRYAVRREVAIRTDMYATVRAAIAVATSVLNYNPVRSLLKVVNYIANVSPIIENAAPYILTLANERVEVASASIRIDETQFTWTAEITLADYEDQSKFIAGEFFSFVVVLGVEEWALFVGQKGRSRPSQEERSATIVGYSETIQYDKPYSLLDEVSFPTPIRARAIAEQLIPGIVWDIVDWTLPAFRFGVSNTSPIEAVATLVKAVGGVLDVAPEGDLTVRPTYPINVPEYSATTTDFFFDYIDNVLSFDTSEVVELIKNRFRIMDVADSGLSDRIEFTPDPNTNFYRGTIFVYPAPWRTDLTLTHTSPSPVDIFPQGVSYIEKSEQVEFLAGKGTVGYPIDSITNVVWIGVSLGGLAHDADGKELSTAVTDHAYSVAQVTYNTRALTYRINSGAKIVQFLVEDEI